MPTPAARSLAVLVAGAVLAAGCNRPSRTVRRPLAGAVVIDGVPARAGVISLTPREGHAGPVASAPIQDGRYAFTTANGPTVGPYRAVVVFVRDAAEARSFQPAHDKARPPRPIDVPAPAADGGAAPLEAMEGPVDEPRGVEGGPARADAPAARVAEPEERVPAPLPPANMREFDVEVPAVDPPRLDFAITGGGSP